MLISLITATLVGMFASDSSIEKIKPLGDLFINLMFTLVVPLVFFTITSSIANLNKKAKLSSLLSKTFIIFIITSAISAVIMLLPLLVINPAKDVEITIQNQSQEKLSILNQIVKAISVGNFGELFSKNNMLALIIFSILFGISLRSVDKENKISKSLDILSMTMLKIVKIVMYYAPIGVFAYFANLINSYGQEIISSYLTSLLLYITVSIVYFLVFYTLYAYIAKGKQGVKTFYKNIFSSFSCSLATQSSLASLPTNLETAKEMNIDESVSKVALPLGATIHMEGSSIGAILKIFFLFSVFNMEISSPLTYVSAILIAIASGVVMSGIPGGGLIGEMLIISLYGFPPSSFALISTIGWLIDAPATMLNVCGDIPSCMLIEKMLYKRK